MPLVRSQAFPRSQVFNSGMRALGRRRSQPLSQEGERNDLPLEPHPVHKMYVYYDITSKASGLCPGELSAVLSGVVGSPAGPASGSHRSTPAVKSVL
ncbi:unnamed protein product [Boreogadus saida]